MARRRNHRTGASMAAVALALAATTLALATTAAAAFDVAEVGVPISISFPSAGGAADGSATTEDDDPLSRTKVTLCALDWSAYRADPAASPMFRDILALSRCSGGSRTKTVPFSQLEAEYESRGCGAAVTSPSLPAAAGTAAGFKGAGCVPTGMVFHQSRCGSTLVANMLAALPEGVAYSESSPPQTILTTTRLSETDRVRALRVVVAAMGRPVYLTSVGRDFPHADEDWEPQHLFFKFQSALTMHLGTVRRAFPAVPWAFVHREGVEVLASLLRGATPRVAGPDGKGGGLDPEDAAVASAPCLRSRETGPPAALLAVTGAADEDAALELPPEDYCAASVGLLAASALHHARAARRDGLARAGLLPSSAAGSAGAAALDVGDGDDVSHVAAASGGRVVALGGMLLDAATGRGTVAGVGQGVFVDYPLLPDAAVGLVRSHFGAPIDDDSIARMMEESTRYSKARTDKRPASKGEGEEGEGGGGKEEEQEQEEEKSNGKRRSRRQVEEGHHHREEEADGGKKAKAKAAGVRARPGMDADGNFVADTEHKRQNAWPELVAAAARYVGGVRAAMLRFNPPLDGVAAAGGDPALQALLRAYSPAGPAMAEATVAAAGLRPMTGSGSGDKGSEQGEEEAGASSSSRAAAVEGLPPLPGALAAAALGLYGPSDAAPLEVGFDPKRHVLPLGQGYPMLFPLAAILGEWNPDVTTPPPTYGRYSSLRYFDWRTERAEAEAYRRAEVPFIVRNVPSLVTAVERFRDDATVSALLGAEREYEATAVDGNHFMYYARGRGEGKDWVPPTSDATVKLRDWLPAAHAVSKATVDEERQGLPAWWFGGEGEGDGAGASSSASASDRVDVSEAVPPPKNRQVRRRHYIRATAFPQKREREVNQWILDTLPLFDPVGARPPAPKRKPNKKSKKAANKKKKTAAKKESESESGVHGGGRAPNRLSRHRRHEDDEPTNGGGQDAATPADDGSAAAATAGAAGAGGAAPDPLRPLVPQAAEEAPFFIVDDTQQRGVHCRLGMVGTIAESHYDGSRNFITMQRGRRRYILAPPSECANMALLTEGPSSRHSEVDWSDPAQHGALANALALEVVLQPGDALYLPASYFHYIVSLASESDDPSDGGGYSVQCNSRSGKPVLYTKDLAQCGFEITNTETPGQYSDPDAASKQADRARHIPLWRQHWPSLAAIARGLGKDAEAAVLAAQRREEARAEAAEEGKGGGGGVGSGGVGGGGGGVSADRMAEAVAATLSARAAEYGADVEAAEAEAAKAAAERADADTRRAAAGALPVAAGTLPPPGSDVAEKKKGGGWGKSDEAVRARKAALAAAALLERKVRALSSAGDWSIGRHHERVLRGAGLGGKGAGGGEGRTTTAGGGGLFGWVCGVVAAVAGMRVVAGGVVGVACVSAATAARAWVKRKKQLAKGSKAR